ncbi:MAG: hemerythrin family protein [Rhodospirillales bacterium]|nr:hemerythrin family protein [Rhodospirillales bacterium]
MQSHTVSVFRHASLDREHAEIQEHLNQLGRCVKSENYSSANVLEVLATLMNCLGKHFENEETWMKNHQYLHLDSHKKQHDNLLSVVAEFTEKYRLDPSQAEGENLYGFINEWLIIHSDQADLVVGNYFKSQQYLRKKTRP